MNPQPELGDLGTWSPADTEGAQWAGGQRSALGCPAKTARFLPAVPRQVPGLPPSIPDVTLVTPHELPDVRCGSHWVYPPLTPTEVPMKNATRYAAVAALVAAALTIVGCTSPTAPLTTHSSQISADGVLGGSGN
jgi:hypothetical protein